jgi:FKBP-type peptidyl-prolyl cis-trans isomerase SlyD
MKEGNAVAIRIEDNRIVQLAYRITDTEGRLLEERTPENPYEYVQGSGQILPAIERMVKGKTAGYTLEVQLSPNEAYGAYDPGLVAEVAKRGFPAGVEPAVGMKFSTVGPNGQPTIIRVIEVSDDTVTVDGNHPLAGLEVIFDLRVLDVREGKETEAEAEAPADAGASPADELDIPVKRTLH